MIYHAHIRLLALPFAQAIMPLEILLVNYKRVRTHESHASNCTQTLTLALTLDAAGGQR